MTSARVVLELFRRLNKDLKQTIVMVTNKPEDEKYVDRVVWLKDGLVEKNTRHSRDRLGTDKISDKSHIQGKSIRGKMLLKSGGR